MVTDIEFDRAKVAMRRAGAEAGKASASWVADGNTSEATLRAMLKAWDDGDPACVSAPEPFSGEWADAASLWDVIDGETELDAESCTPEELDELATAYEDAFYDAWQDEAERTVRALLSD